MQKGSVNAVAIEIVNKCIKMKLPNGKTVDILSDVLLEISKWLQTDINLPEAGGFLVGYEDNKSKNISLDGLSCPYPLDTRNRIRFNIVDPKHKLFLFRAKVQKSYYMGVWHTHPQTIPEPSEIDWNDWHDTLNTDRTACEYIFFLIAGTEGARVWVGDFKAKKIIEIFECAKVGGIYKL